MTRMDTNGDLLFREEVFNLVGAAMAVHSHFGPGFLEAVYEEALGLELNARNIPFQSQVPLRLTYRGRELRHTYRADLVAFNDILIELKAITRITDLERAQAIHYLKVTGKPLAIILNFGAPKLEWERLVLT
jgi:GxxExxY protein